MSLTPCDEWPGSRTPAGYGHRWVNGKLEYTHRLAWEEAHGPILDGMLVLHTCDNPPCRNVEHLFLGTYTDNNRDMVAKGRHWSQQKTHCPRNHELAGDNLEPAALAKGQRRCLICRREQTRQAQKRYVAKKVSV